MDTQYFIIGVYPFMIFFLEGETFVQYVTAWLVQIWTNWACENADKKKERPFSWRRKNIKKWTKADEKQILFKSTFI